MNGHNRDAFLHRDAAPDGSERAATVPRLLVKWSNSEMVEDWKHVLFSSTSRWSNAYILKCVANRPLPSNHREWSLLSLRWQWCTSYATTSLPTGKRIWSGDMTCLKGGRRHTFLSVGALHRNGVSRPCTGAPCVGHPCASLDHVSGSTMAISRVVAIHAYTT